MEDKDLQFLKECSNDQLKLLADFILYDKDGKLRYMEELSKVDGFDTNYPNCMVELVPAIVEELQRFGGNTAANILRGHGVRYREILEDVCKQLKVNYNKSNSTELIETYLLQKFLIMSIDKMSEEDVHHLSSMLSKETLKNQIGLLKAGSPLFLRLTTMLIANLAKKYGLKQAGAMAARFAGSRVFAVLSGPVGWVLTGLWTAFDIAGPAYRVTIPCVLTIAYLRNVHDNVTEEELDDILK